MRLDHLTRRQRKTTINMIYMHAGCALASAFIPYDHIHVPTVTAFVFFPPSAVSCTGPGAVKGKCRFYWLSLRTARLLMHITTAPIPTWPILSHYSCRWDHHAGARAESVTQVARRSRVSQAMRMSGPAARGIVVT